MLEVERNWMTSSQEKDERRDSKFSQPQKIRHVFLLHVDIGPAETNYFLHDATFILLSKTRWSSPEPLVRAATSYYLLALANKTFLRQNSSRMLGGRWEWAEACWRGQNLLGEGGDGSVIQDAIKKPHTAHSSAVPWYIYVYASHYCILDTFIRLI